MKYFLHRINYLSKSKFDMINWYTIEIALTPNPVLFFLWENKKISGLYAI